MAHGKLILPLLGALLASSRAGAAEPCPVRTEAFPRIVDVRHGWAFFGREEFDLLAVIEPADTGGDPCADAIEPDPVVEECLGGDLPCLIDGVVSWNSRLPGNRLRLQAVAPGLALFTVVPHPRWREAHPTDPGTPVVIRVFARGAQLNAAHLTADPTVDTGRDLNGDGIVDAADMAFD